VEGSTAAGDDEEAHAMTWTAVDRFGIDPAPGALGLAQDLLNTVSVSTGRADLLADLPGAQDWADRAVAQWSAVTGRPAPEVVLDTAGLEELRIFRHVLQQQAADAADSAADGAEGPDDDAEDAAEAGPESASARGSDTALPAVNAAARLRLDSDGRVRLEARGAGGRRLVSMVLAAVYEAQLADVRRRLKVCRNPQCRLAFYDRSRNNSGVWHDVKKCGNAANLRAYRARRRAQA
jgi:predicted RNA-binding Zn ribbon-like protein